MICRYFTIFSLVSNIKITTSITDVVLRTLYKIYTMDITIYSAVMNVKNPNTTPKAFGIIKI